MSVYRQRQSTFGHIIIIENERQISNFYGFVLLLGNIRAFSLSLSQYAMCMCVVNKITAQEKKRRRKMKE